MERDIIYSLSIILVTMLVQFYCLSVDFEKPIKPANITIKGHFANKKSNMTFNMDVKQPTFKTKGDYKFDRGGMSGMYDLADSYVQTIFGGSVENLVEFGKRAIKEDDFDIQTEVKALLFKIMKPFAASVVFGVIFIVCCPFAGCVFCCCRRTNKCGGRRVQEYSPKARTWLMVLNFLVFSMGILISVGLICSYVAMVSIPDCVRKFVEIILNALDDTSNFVSSSSSQLEEVAIGTFKFGTEIVFRDLENVAGILGMGVAQRIVEEANLNETERDVKGMQKKMNGIITGVKNTSKAIEVFITKSKALVKALGTYKTKLEGTCDELAGLPVLGGDGPAVSCPDTAALDFDEIYSQLPSITSHLKHVDKLQDIELAEKFDEGLEIFFGMTDKIDEEAKSHVKGLRETTEKVQARAEKTIKDITKQIENILNIEQHRSTVKRGLDVFEQYLSYVHQMSVSINLMQVLIASSIIFGLYLGNYTRNPTGLPTHRTPMSDYGGKTLMCSVGCSFCFYGPLTIVVIAFFVPGGLLSGVVCPAIKNLDQLLDGPGGLIAKTNVSGTLELRDKITYSGAMKQCQNDDSLYKVLKLGSSAKLNFSGKVEDLLTNKLRTYFKGFTTQLKDFSVLTDDLEEVLRTFSEAADINISGYSKLLNQGTAKISFKGFIGKIRKGAETIEAAISTYNQATGADVSRDVVDSMKARANELEAIEKNEYKETHNAQGALTDEVKLLEILITNPSLKQRIDDNLDKLKAMERLLIEASVRVVQSEADKFLNRIENTLYGSLLHCLEMFDEKIAKCGVIHKIYMSVVDQGLCQLIPDTLNGVWVSIGFSLFFILPAIVLSTKLSKHFYIMQFLHPNDPRGRKRSSSRRASGAKLGQQSETLLSAIEEAPEKRVASSTGNNSNYDTTSSVGIKTDWHYESEDTGPPAGDNKASMKKDEVTPLVENDVNSEIKATSSVEKSEIKAGAPVEDESNGETKAIAPIEKKSNTEFEATPPIESKSYGKTEVITPDKQSNTETTPPIENITDGETIAITPVEKKSNAEFEATPTNKDTFNETKVITPVENEVGVAESKPNDLETTLV